MRLAVDRKWGGRVIRWIIVVAALLVFFVVLPGLAVGAYFWRFYPSVPQAEYPEPDSPTQARLQDLDFLARLPSIDRSFSEAERTRFEQHMAVLRANAAEMSDAIFLMGVAAAPAISENGHTNIYRRNMLNRLNSLPVRFFWFEEGLYIVRTRTSEADLLGARVIRYDGVDPPSLLVGLDPYIGGNDAYLQIEGLVFLASPMAMHAAGLARTPGQVTLTLELRDGSRVDRAITAEADATPFMAPDMHLQPMEARQETDSGNAWRVLDPGGEQLPLYTRHPDVTLWRDELPHEGEYIRMRSIGGEAEDGTRLEDWLNAARDELTASPKRYLVLDLRSNGGGDLTRTMGFARNITDLVTPDGRIYVLTDGGTFSAAIVTAAYAIHDAGDRGLIVGSEIGDFEQFWAEGQGPMRLPNSGLSITVTTGYHDWENGCTNWVRCYWLSAAMGVAAGPLTPDIEAPLAFSDYSRGIDSTIEAVLAHEAELLAAATAP